MNTRKIRYPKSLTRHFKILKDVVTNREIAEITLEAVRTGQTTDQLIGKVGDILLAERRVNKVNDLSYEFKKALLIRINLVVKSFKFKMITTSTTSISEEGQMYVSNVKTITGESPEEDKGKIWFKEATDFQDYIILKGSKKKINNNSTAVLRQKAEIPLRVKEIDPRCIDLYTVLLYEANRTKVNEPNYFSRLREVAKETKANMGYIYHNFRKLDSNTRNYPLSRFGFAVEYGDAFEKFMIEPADPYYVNDVEIEGAIEYLRDEFKTKDYKQLVYRANYEVQYNLAMLEEYEKGRKASFTVTHKELGKYLHIIDIYENIITNSGGMTRSCASYDFTNSGGINAANQFGDRKFLNTMNLLGGKDVYDTHQRVADALGMKRKDAKGVMQGPNHGGAVKDEHKAMVNEIFGDTYKYIRLTAEYGAKLADAGVRAVELVRPDGVKAIWYPYTLNSKISMEDGTTVNAVTPYGGDGRAKNLGLAVSCLHSHDAFTEHYVQTKLFDLGIHVKTTLDNFYGRPSIKKWIVKFTFEALNIAKGNMERQLKDIERQTGIMRGWNLPEREGNIVPSDNIL